MKYVITVLIMAGFLGTVEIPFTAGFVCDKANINEDYNYHRHRPLYRILSPDILIDSCCGYSLWTQIQENIAYSLIADGIQVVNRNYEHVGLRVTQLPGDLSYMIQDLSVDFAGGERNPTSVAGAKPYISYPRLIPNWGEMVAKYDSGGWFSSGWDGPVDLGPGDVNVSRVIGKELPNGNILFIGDAYDPGNIIYRTRNFDLTNEISSGILGSGVYYWGYDINGGIAYVFYYDGPWYYPSNIYYQTTTDGVTWSGEQTYNMVWPDPYINNGFYWRQTAVTDAGNPILVFDVLDEDDSTYPYYGTVYVSAAEGQPCTAVSPPDSECFYPTIATGGNMAAVLYCMPRNNLPDSLNWWDLYVVWSTDNGATWGDPQNVTSELTARPGLQQLAKRIDTLRNRVYYVYAVNMYYEHDPLWQIMNGYGCASYLYLGETQYVGIEETALRLTPDALRFLEVYPNPFSNKIDIRFQIEDDRYLNSGKEHSAEGISATQYGGLKIYDATGRLVKDFLLPTAYSILPTVISWDGTDHTNRKLPSGVYFVRLEAQGRNITEKIIKLK